MTAKMAGVYFIFCYGTGAGGMVSYWFPIEKTYQQITTGAGRVKGIQDVLKVLDE